MKPAQVYYDKEVNSYVVKYIPDNHMSECVEELEAKDLSEAIDEAMTVTGYRLDEIDF